MSATKDASLLLHFFRQTQDPRYLLVAHRRYHAAVVHLRHELRRPDTLQDDALLATIDMLVVCESHPELAQNKGTWRRHSQGSRAVLRVRGPASFDWSSRVTRDVVYGAVCIAVIEAIVSRQPLLFGERRWLSKLWSSCDGKLWCLFHLACEIPTMLASLDQLKSFPDEDSVAGNLQLLEDLVHLEERLQKWLVTWYMTIPGVPIRTKDITEYPGFLARFGPEVTSAYTTALDFDSHFTATGHRVYWFFLFPVREAIHILWKRAIMTSELPYPHLEYAAHAVDEVADSICQMVPFEVDALAAGATFRSLLWAEEWHRSRGNVLKANCARTIVRRHGEASADDTLVQNFEGWAERKNHLVRRMLHAESIGPGRCCMKTVRRKANYSRKSEPPILPRSDDVLSNELGYSQQMQPIQAPKSRRRVKADGDA